jgi:hypothetical protein
MMSVWRSANETEVYALSFLLSLIALALADRAGVTGRWRHAALAIYVLALAIPLHLSALVIAPAVVFFAAAHPGRQVQWWLLALLAGAAALGMALGTLSLAFGILSMVLLGAALLLPGEEGVGARLKFSTALGGLILLAASAVSVLYFRAQFDPFVNQGNPNTLDAMFGVIGREQYDVPPLWPRRAPLWLQIGNVAQYADWQVAFGLDQWVGASWRRTPFTILFVILAIIGARWHRARDVRSFRAMALALVSASLGTVLVLNLRAGPSFGVGVLPADALHEARERDYFFAVAFALGAAWSGVGAARVAARLAERWQRINATLLASAIAAMPIALNWRATDRRVDGPVTLAQQLGTAMLDAAPERGVLFVGGDNDTYPLWYLQEVHGIRRDVTVVTIPLLPARWYREELKRRHALMSETDLWRGTAETIAHIVQNARRQDRPTAFAASVAAPLREALGGYWLARGMVFVLADGPPPQSTVTVVTTRDSLRVAATGDLTVDTIALRKTPDQPATTARDDPARAYVATLLSCPAQILSAVRARRGSVDPRCNLR